MMRQHPAEDKKPKNVREILGAKIVEWKRQASELVNDGPPKRQLECAVRISEDLLKDMTAIQLPEFLGARAEIFALEIFAVAKLSVGMGEEYPAIRAIFEQLFVNGIKDRLEMIARADKGELRIKQLEQDVRRLQSRDNLPLAAVA